jgi:hypothetical protein
LHEKLDKIHLSYCQGIKIIQDDLQPSRNILRAIFLC